MDETSKREREGREEKEGKKERKKKRVGGCWGGGVSRYVQI